MADGGFKLGSAFVDITAKDSTKAGLESAKKDIDKTTKEAGEKGGNNLGNGIKGKLAPHVAEIGATIGAAFAVDKVTDFFKDSISEAKKANLIGAQTSAVIKSTGDVSGVTKEQVDELSKSIEAKTGIDHLQIQAGENVLLSFQNVRNEAGKGNDVFDQATKSAADLATARGMSLPAANKLLGKSLNDPIKGMAALAKVGVSFTAAQKEAIKSDVARGNSLGAQKIILGQLNKAVGGSAASQDTASKKMSVAWDNLKEEIGAKLLPIIMKLENWVADQLIPALINAGTWVNAHVVPALSSMAKFVGQNVKWLGPLVGAVVAIIAAVKIWTAVQLVFNTVMEANPIVLVALAIAGLVIGLVIAYEKVGWFKAAVNTAWSVIKTATSAMWTVIKTVFDAIKTTINAFVSTIKFMYNTVRSTINTVNSVIRSIGSTFSSVYNTVKGYVGNIVSFIGGLPGKAKSALSSLGSAIGGAISSAFKSAVSTVKTDVSNVVAVVKGLPGDIRNIAGDMTSAGSHIISAFWDGIKSAAGSALNLGSEFRNAVNNAIGLPHTFKLPGINKGPVHINLPSFTIPAFATGGLFNGAGTGTSDSNLAHISDGEYITNAAATKKNLGLLNAINSGANISGASGNNVSIQKVVIDASTISDFNRVVEIFGNLSKQYQQTTGRRATA